MVAGVIIAVLLGAAILYIVCKLEDHRMDQEAKKAEEKRAVQAAHNREIENAKKEKEQLKRDHQIKEILMVENCSAEKAYETHDLLKKTLLLSEFDDAVSINQKRTIIKKARLFTNIDGYFEYRDYFEDDEENLYRFISDEEKLRMIEKYIATGIDANSELLLKSIEGEFEDPYELFGRDDLSDKNISEEDMEKILRCFSEKFGFEGRIGKEDRFSYNRYSLQLIWMYCIYFGYLKSLCDKKGSYFPCSTSMDFEIYSVLKNLFFDIVHYNIYDYKQVLRDHWDFLQEKIDECIEYEEEEIQ